MAFEVEWLEMPVAMRRAGHLVASREFGPGPHIVLIGHMDTVFTKDSPFQTMEVANGGLRGPGIVDMKGGNAAIIYALDALIETGALKRGKITVFLVGDEEDIGQPISVSRHHLQELSASTDYALGFEDGSADEIVVGRRGISGWSIRSTGVQGHSASIFSEQIGSGASFEIARILSEFYKTVRGPIGLTFNPGLVVAGSTVSQVDESEWDLRAQGKSNVVADAAHSKGAIRFMSNEQYEAARRTMENIVSNSLPGTSSHIEFFDAYPAMQEKPGNLELLAVVGELHDKLKLSPAAASAPQSRGAADISFIESRYGSIDGLGVEGHGRHSEEETLKVASLTTSTKRAALLILQLSETQTSSLPQPSDP